MTDKYSVYFLKRAKDYISDLSKAEKGSLAANVDMMLAGDTEFVQTKQLRGPVRELIFGNHRLSYFFHNKAFYFIEGWRKKTQKTPGKFIDFAVKMYKEIAGS